MPTVGFISSEQGKEYIEVVRKRYSSERATIKSEINKKSYVDVVFEAYDSK